MNCPGSGIRVSDGSCTDGPLGRIVAATVTVTVPDAGNQDKGTATLGLQDPVKVLVLQLDCTGVCPERVNTRATDVLVVKTLKLLSRTCNDPLTVASSDQTVESPASRPVILAAALLATLNVVLPPTDPICAETGEVLPGERFGNNPTPCNT